MTTDLLQHALRGAQQPPSPPPAPLQRLERVLVVGAGGTLGAALLAEALVAGRFQRVAAVLGEALNGPLPSTLRGLHMLPASALQAGAAVDLQADLAFIVFERQREARYTNGRDLAFLQPEAADLVPLAQAFRAGGVQRLLVVVPHAPALLPQALRAGFASEAEAAVAALGFSHLLFLRAAQAAPAPTVARSRAQRFADWWLSQLAWMVPSQQQPLRAVKLAAVAVQIAQGLARSAPGTRVLAPEQLWQAAQGGPAGETSLAALLAPP